MSDPEAFEAQVADMLFDLPGVTAVSLGGSRAYGGARDDSDWDFSIYYRSSTKPFDPADLKAIGWPGVVSDIGGWGGGVFNGGAWLRIHGERVDVHYRDLDVIDAIEKDAQKGEFRIEPLMFHLAGIPTYLLLAELALGRTLRGMLLQPSYPDALAVKACRVWMARARGVMDYAINGHAMKGHTLFAYGLAAEAVCCYAHAVAANRRLWVTNDKHLLAMTGLDAIDAMLAEPGGAVERLSLVRARCEAELAGRATEE